MDLQDKTTSAMSIIQVIATAIIALTSIVGIFLVVSQLDKFGQQNVMLERTLKQSYRPIGVSRYANDQNLIVLYYEKSDSRDKFSFGCAPKLINYGGGVLTYLGAISYLSKNEISFRDSLLNGRIQTFIFDSLSNFERRTAILPKENIDIMFIWKNQEFCIKYYMYNLFIYKDQDGNLYDTEHLAVLPFTKPVVQDSGLIAKLDKEVSGYVKEKYSAYTIADKEKLLKLLKGKNSDFYIAISNR